ncbi:hypothetical protein GTY57_20305, partial [Streptomyces sp. SID5475]|nr:hypothetical protein [Streptomyces sp. SID5475]
MSTERRPAAEPVVRVDLGHRGGRPQTPVALAARVREALARTPAAGTRCFLVLDDAPDLMDHQVHYERLYSHGPAEVLCLAYGGADSRELLLPHVLQAAGVLWIPDAFAGADGTEPGPGEGRGGGGARRGEGPGGRVGKPGPETVDEALRPMVELLSELSVFRAVLGGIAEIPQGVAVPAARVLEHDLTEEAKARAWRQALEELTGADVPPPALVVEGAPGSDA